MFDNRVQRIHAQRGQAAVESALVIPVSMFVVLGLLQMGMLQQARFMADYAAYRGARAASVQRLECEFVTRAEIAALVPTLGRSDDLTNWESTYNKYSSNTLNNHKIVITHWKLSNPQTPFDKPLGPSDAPERVSVRVRYYYEMEIPFANWLFAKFFLAQQGLEAWGSSADPLMSTRQYSDAGGGASGGSADAMQDFAIVKSAFDGSHYVAPIYASWSMRMFSQASQQEVSSGTGDCGS